MLKSFKHLSAGAQQFSQGNSSKRLNPDDYPKRFKTAAGAIRTLQDGYMRQMFDMQVVSEQISATTRDMRLVLKEQKALSTQVFQDTESLAAANQKNADLIDESVSLSNQMQQNTNLLLDASRQLSASSQHTKEVVRTQLEATATISDIIDNISETSRNSTAFVKALYESSRQIETILATVQAFYKQTQLLALNASIESARAGEAGKGFAVVANEIRSLATNSSASVDRIADMIKAIDRDVHNVLGHSESVENKVKEAVVHTHSLTAGFSQLDAAYSEVDSYIGQMSDKLSQNSQLYIRLDQAIRQSAVASDTVASEMKGINDKVQALYDHTDAIEGLEINFKDTAKSLHALTEKSGLNLLSDAESAIDEQASDLIGTLTRLLHENRELIQRDSSVHKNILDRFHRDNARIGAVWTNAVDGAFIHSDPPAGIKNASIREWFKRSLEGNTFISKVYISAISKSPCATVSMPIKDEQGRIVGVLGADLNIVY